MAASRHARGGDQQRQPAPLTTSAQYSSLPALLVGRAHRPRQRALLKGLGSRRTGRRGRHAPGEHRPSAPPRAAGGRGGVGRRRHGDTAAVMARRAARLSLFRADRSSVRCRQFAAPDALPEAGPTASGANRLATGGEILRAGRAACCHRLQPQWARSTGRRPGRLPVRAVFRISTWKTAPHSPRAPVPP